MSAEQLNIPAVVTIQHVVRNYMNERNYSMSNYKRLMQIAIRGFANLSITELRSVSVFYAIPDVNGQIFMPTDYVDYVAVGYREGSEIFILSRNKDLYIKKGGVNGNIEVLPTEVNDGFAFIDHYIGTAFITGMYGIKGSLSAQHFNVDSENKIMQFSSVVPRSEMIIQYVSTGVSMNGNTYIPRFAEPALIEWLYWRDSKGRPQGNQTRGVIMDSKQDYIEEINILRDIQTLPTYQECMDAIYTSTTQAPKR